MWKGRFAKATADLVQQYGESISYDWRLYKHDIAGSIAHARAQVSAKLLSSDEFAAIEKGLREIEKEIEAGEFNFSIELEDIHMNIESALTERIGAPGAKLHTARSRNDQVATDTRLYCREEIDNLTVLITGLQQSLLKQAEQYAAALIPGYTHLQRGQPVTVGHHLLAYVEMLDRDKSRLADCRKRINACPLGSGALAGSTINLDRQQISDELGFDRVTTNSMDAISDRDYIAEFLFDMALVGTHLSRLSEDLILWCSSEFGFATLSDAHTTGSSLMPQKKNPDVCAEMIADMAINLDTCEAAASDPLLLATDLADYLVKNGVPFRQAHELVGQAVALSVQTKTPLDQLDLSQVSEHYGADAKDVFDLQTALAARTNPGAPSIDNVRAEVARWKQSL